MNGRVPPGATTAPPLARNDLAGYLTDGHGIVGLQPDPAQRR
jgi:hypothetical protein